MPKITHGLTKTRMYRVWSMMKQRCYNPKSFAYHRYGGRGITVCERWKNSFMNFYEDMKKDHKNNLTLDRIDNDKGYSPENCRWATPKEQASNMVTSILYGGETATDASIRLSGGTSLVSRRLFDGWSLEKAFTTPLNKIKSHKK